MMRLDIFISNHCFNCQEALQIAAEAGQIPRLEVRVINVDEAAGPIPAKVVAVPTYLLDGQTVSLGNPEPALFLARLASLAKEKTTG